MLGTPLAHDSEHGHDHDYAQSSPNHHLATIHGTTPKFYLSHELQLREQTV